MLPNLVRILAPLPKQDGYFGIHCLSGHKWGGEQHRVQLYREYRVDDREAHGRLFFDDQADRLAGPGKSPHWFMVSELGGWLGGWVTSKAPHVLRAPLARISLRLLTL